MRLVSVRCYAVLEAKAFMAGSSSRRGLAQEAYEP